MGPVEKGLDILQSDKQRVRRQGASFLDVHAFKTALPHGEQ